MSEQEQTVREPKCRVEDGKHVIPCTNLREAAQPGNPTPKAKGVFCWDLHKVGGGGPTRTFFGVKSGEFIKGGILFNFCPFCGEKIDEMFVNDSAA